MIGKSVIADPKLVFATNDAPLRHIPWFEMINQQFRKQASFKSVHPCLGASQGVPSSFRDGEQPTERFKAVAAKKLHGPRNISEIFRPLIRGGANVHHHSPCEAQ